MVTQKQAKAFAGTGGMIFIFFLISIYFNVKLIVLLKILHLLKHLISKMDFTSTKYSGHGSFTVKKGTIDKLLFLLKAIGIYP